MVTKRFDAGSPAVEKVGNILVHRIGMGGRGRFSKFAFQLSAGFAALSLNRKNKYDAVWAVMAHSAGVPAAVFKLFKPRIPFVLTLQEGDPPEHIERIMRPLWPLFSRAFASATIVTAISTFLGAWARRCGFTGPLEIIPNGVDVKHFAGVPAPHEGKVLITTSRLVRKNAIDDVIRALALLPEIRFKILGAGPDESMLKNLAKKEGVSSRVEFAGHVDHKDMPKHLHAADIFIRPSRSEGMGSSFIEAMAAGLPVIATQEGGISDFLFDAKRNPDKPTTGWAVDKNSPQQIAEAVKEIIGNPEAAKNVVENGRKLAIEKYDWDLIALAMRKKTFDKVLKNG
jgi:glycosyltransferase involved in cell wall biosynthesis